MTRKMFPGEQVTVNEYKTKELFGGLQCITCGMFVDQDATVHPGQCLGCFMKQSKQRFYVSHYDEHTFMQYGVVCSMKDVIDRNKALYQYGVSIVGEKWVPGYGITAVWSGPELDKDTQNLLCIRILDKEVA